MEKSRLLTIHAVAVELETCVIEHEVDSAPSGVFPHAHYIPQTVHVVPKDILLGSCEVLPTSRLKGFDLLLSHVDQEREIRRVTPQTDYKMISLLSSVHEK